MHAGLFYFLDYTIRDDQAVLIQDKEGFPTLIHMSILAKTAIRKKRHTTQVSMGTFA